MADPEVQRTINRVELSDFCPKQQDADLDIILLERIIDPVVLEWSLDVRHVK